MLESINTPDPASAREAAFSAPAFVWRGTALHPFAIAREADWQLHCRRIGLPSLGDCIGGGDTFAAHAIRLLWFCAHEPSEWLSVWMVGREAAPIYLDTRIRAWAEQHIPPGSQAEAIKLALSIYDRAYESRATPLDDDPGEDAAGNAAGPSVLLSM